MKKTVAYDIHLCINNSGVVVSTECECAAGMGPHAHCKHIRALLLGLVSFCRGQQLVVAASCTDKLQTFHRPKQHHSGSPVKAHCLSLAGVQPKYILFDPTPLRFAETAEQINRRVQNEAINYAATYEQIPLLQTFSPANTYGVNNDHDYMEISPAEHFLRSANISAISAQQAADVEAHTRGQANSRLWHVERSK